MSIYTNPGIWNSSNIFSDIVLLTIIVEALKRSLSQTTAGAVAQQLGRKSAQEGKSTTPRPIELNPIKREYI